MPHLIRIAAICLAIAGSLVPEARAIPAITCHCFTDRSFDPARPAAADPYLLATVQNSFLAAACGVDKRSIVMKKQTGTSAEDLWIAYGVASPLGLDGDDLLRRRQDNGSWPAALAPLPVTAQTAGERFLQELRAKAPASRLADAVVDDLLLRAGLAKTADLAELRRQGTGSKELIMATVAGTAMRKPAAQLLRTVKNGGKSWGALLNDAHLDPAALQGEMTRRIPPRR